MQDFLASAFQKIYNKDIYNIDWYNIDNPIESIQAATCFDSFLLFGPLPGGHSPSAAVLIDNHPFQIYFSFNQPIRLAHSLFILYSPGCSLKRETNPGELAR